MKIYVDSTNCIHDVDSTQNPSLKELVINNMDNPFKDWTIAKICCYRAFVEDGAVTSFSPYIPSSIVELIDRLARENEELRARANKTDRELDQLLTDVIPRLMG